MGNNRKAIRDALKALLIGSTAADANVFTSRTSPLWESETPAILISTPEESTEFGSLQANRYRRTLTLNVEVKIVATENVADDLDDLVNQIESILILNQSLTGTVQSTTLQSTSTRVDSETDQDIGVAELTFECKYMS